ncbi:hypothetical protein ON010_g18867 [Phytophthora cinnamomi]|nr:hypothetical protein ON010_g18867 [Phytophthora cinnamomi]
MVNSRCSDDVCSDNLSDTGSAGEGMYDDLFSSDEEPEEPYWDPDPTLRWDVWQIDDFIISENTDEKTSVTTSEYFVVSRNAAETGCAEDSRRAPLASHNPTPVIGPNTSIADWSK